MYGKINSWPWKQYRHLLFRFRYAVGPAFESYDHDCASHKRLDYIYSDPIHIRPTECHYAKRLFRMLDISASINVQSIA